MAKEVRLKDVTAANWEAVVGLELTDDQEDMVASNAYSLAESKFTPLARPRAVYAGKSVVGFLMYEPLADEGKPQEVSIYRFMIDRKHQGKGYGRAALAQRSMRSVGLPASARSPFATWPTTRSRSGSMPAWALSRPDATGTAKSSPKSRSEGRRRGFR
jgi:GNAT superfamily N-acetyltransferase